MNLPEKLRNLGIQQVPESKVKVHLSDRQINAISEVFTSEVKGKGA